MAPIPKGYVSQMEAIRGLFFVPSGFPIPFDRQEEFRTLVGRAGNARMRGDWDVPFVVVECDRGGGCYVEPRAYQKWALGVVPDPMIRGIKELEELAVREYLVEPEAPDESPEVPDEWRIATNFDPNRPDQVTILQEINEAAMGASSTGLKRVSATTLCHLKAIYDQYTQLGLDESMPRALEKISGAFHSARIKHWSGHWRAQKLGRAGGDKTKYSEEVQNLVNHVFDVFHRAKARISSARVINYIQDKASEEGGWRPHGDAPGVDLVEMGKSKKTGKPVIVVCLRNGGSRELRPRSLEPYFKRAKEALKAVTY